MLKYTEYVAEFGTLPELNLASANMTLIEIYMLDLIGILFAILFIVVIVLFIMRMLFRLYCKKNKNKTD